MPGLKHLLLSLLWLNSATASCPWTLEYSTCTSSCGGFGIQQVDFIPPAGCNDVPPASYLQSCGDAYCQQCDTLDVQVTGLTAASVIGLLASTSDQAWEDANLSISYSSAISAYILRHNTVISAALPDTDDSVPFFGVVQSRWQPSTLQNLTATVVVNAECTACPVGFFKDMRLSNPICTEIRSPCLDGEIGAGPATATTDRMCLPRVPGNCARASLLDQDVCVACKAGYWLSNGSCVTTCPVDAPYPVTSLGSCRQCPAGQVQLSNGCTPCSNSQCLYCLVNQTSVCNECEAGQTLKLGTCVEEAATVTVTFAGDDIQSSLIANYLSNRFNLAYRVATVSAASYTDHLNVDFAACRLDVRQCLAANELLAVFQSDELRTDIQEDLALEYTLDGSRVDQPTETNNDEGLFAGLSTTVLAVIGVCFLALVALVLALFIRNRNSESLILRRSKEQHELLRLHNGHLQRQDSKADKRPYLERHRDAILWFKASEFVRMAGQGRNGKPYLWMTGIVNSRKAERHLTSQRPGSFFIRVSSEDCGYLLSVTTLSGAVIHIPIRIGSTPEIRHGYRLGQSLGGGVYHMSLRQLVQFYSRRSIMRGVRLRHAHGDGGRSFRVLMRHVRMMTSTSTLAASTPPSGSQHSNTSEEVVYETLDAMQERRQAKGYGDSTEDLYQPLQVAQLEWEDSRIDKDGMLLIGTPSPVPSLERLHPSHALAASDAVVLQLDEDDSNYLTQLQAHGSSCPDSPAPSTTVGYLDDIHMPALFTQAQPWLPVPPPRQQVASCTTLRRALSAPTLASDQSPQPLRRSISASGLELQGGKRPRTHGSPTRQAVRPVKAGAAPMLTNRDRSDREDLRSSSGTSSLEAQPVLRKPIGHSTEPQPDGLSQRGPRRPLPALPVYSAKSGLPVSAVAAQQKSEDSRRSARVPPPRSPFLRLAPNIYPVQRGPGTPEGPSSSSTDPEPPKITTRTPHRATRRRRSQPQPRPQRPPAEVSISSRPDGSLALRINNETISLQPGSGNVHMQLRQDGGVDLRLSEESAA
eukprot:m.171678 g.171678  ORF g.171678 m.171678 type:complete len:1037 (-) comp16708_c0_seq1:1212-4322(-)